MSPDPAGQLERIERSVTAIRRREERPRANLDIMDLSAIMQSLGTSRRSGKLVVRRGDGEEKHLHFEEGKIRLVSGALPGGGGTEDLGSTLIRSGLLPSARVQEALARAGADGANLCAQLVATLGEDGEWGRESLESWIQQECTDLLAWSDVHCEFFEIEDQIDAEDLSDLPGRGVPVDRVLMSALSRADEWEEVRRHFDPEVDVFEITPEGYEAVAMGEAAHLANLVDGTRDISEIRELSQDGALDTCKGLLGMLKDGHVKAKSGAQLAVMAELFVAKEDWGKAARLYKRALELAPGRSEALLSAAEVCEQVGDLDGAQRHLTEYISRMTHQSNYAAAAKACHWLVRLKPNDPEPKLLLYRVLRASGDARRARSVGKELVLALEQRGAFDRAIEVLGQLRGDFPDDVEIQQLDTWIRLISIELSEAAVQYEELARTYLAEGDIREATKFSVQAWAKTLGARAARLENEVDMLRHEVEELREENDGFSSQMDRLRKRLSEAKAALKSIELSYLMGRGAIPPSASGRKA
jgi:tetratricopeptide (TPR) repeat protein